MNQGHLKSLSWFMDEVQWVFQDVQFELVWVTFFNIIYTHYIKSMPKIKDIVDKMKLNGNEYHDLSLLVSKRVWLVIAVIYYLSYLFTVGGFYFGPISLEYLAMATFHLYSILVIATAWFFYSLCEYAIAIYLPNRRFLILVPIFLWVITTAIALVTHIGIIGNIDSVLSLIK